MARLKWSPRLIEPSFPFSCRRAYVSEIRTPGLQLRMHVPEEWLAPHACMRMCEVKVESSSLLLSSSDAYGRRGRAFSVVALNLGLE
jgi:hypothetical protein